MKRIAAATLGLALLVSATGAAAHHSGAMFDATKNYTVVGTVKDFDWANPHAWIYVMAPAQAGGGIAPWTIECSAINIIARKGWKATSLMPGDKVTIVVHPAKDGTNQGLVLNVKLANGTTLTDHDY